VPVVSCDFETRSTVPLPDTGVYPYAAHPTTDLWCLAYAFDQEEPQLWWPGEPFPARLRAHIEAKGEMRAWNAAFERVIWRDLGVPRYGFPPVLDGQWVCTAAEAAAMSLPRSLDGCAQVLGISEQKDDEGYNLMMRMSRPRSIRDDGTLVWWDVPDRKKRLGEYCVQDVRTERSAAKALRRLNPRERQLYLLNEKINDRGVPIDRELALAAKAIADEGVERASIAIRELTNGAVVGVTNTGQLRAWLGSRGLPSHSVAKGAVRDLLSGELPDDVRAVLEARAEAGRSSVAKIDSMLTVAMADDRLRGLSLYHGAGTGRFTGRLVQPHNFTRGDVSNVEEFIPIVLKRAYDVIDLIENPVAVVSSLLRALLCAPEGYEFMAGDFSAIETRVLNWVAGQDDVVENWRKYDAGDTSRHPYKINAARFYGVPVSEVGKGPMYQGGKFQELGCGYGMGWAKAIDTANTAQYGYLTLSEQQAKDLVQNYRDTHPRVTELWKDANAAALNAVAYPGSVERFGALSNCAFVKAGAYLYLILPSKRLLCYPDPRIVDRMTPWGETRPAVEFAGSNAVTRKWERGSLYGGLIVENVVQAVSRDLLAEAMFRAEDAKYYNVMNVHDELVSLVPKGFGSLHEFQTIMREVPTWAKGCPINTEAWQGERYRK
jgi:DNA polymerase